MADPKNRIVHYVMSDGSCRPLLVTRAWSDVMVNGTLEIDGTNDYQNVPNWTPPNPRTEPFITSIWKTSIGWKDNSDRSITSNTWHWPEID